MEVAMAESSSLRADLHGVLSAVVTPFTAGGEDIDEAALRAVVEHAVNAGIHGVIPCGSTGEFATLTPDERRRVVEVVADAADGRTPVIPQVGAMTTTEAAALARHAESCGAAVVMVVAPYYEALTVAEIGDYYRRVADAVSIPVMVYNLPAVTGVNLAPAEVARMARDVPSIRYVKDTTGDLSQAAQLIHDHADVVSTFVGWDPLYFAALCEGAAGSVLGAGNIVPGQTAEIYELVHAGRIAEARERWEHLYPLMRFLVSGRYTPAVKAGVQLLGLASGHCRAPVAAVEPQRVAELEALLKGVGAL
jgi:4-hydroxy-tetrahydrodipicolinate synthase